MKQNRRIGNLRVFAAAGVFMLALFMPMFLCGCGAASEGDALILSLSGEADAQEPCSEEKETARTAYGDIEKTEDIKETEAISQVYVYVCGAVEQPGVYQAAAGSRLFELIEMAGGFTQEADRSSLNLARSVTDGEQITVYTVEETAKGMTSVSENGATQLDSGLVNINTAPLSELTKLSGIGESRAQAIIDYREKNGSFGSIEEIKKVDGIKDGLFSKIKDYITI